MKPLILLSNDDGVQAKGLNELISMLEPLADLIVMAPDGPRSGSACAISSHLPLTYRCVEDRTTVKIYACNGTPVDCTKLALELFTERKPDLVVSGINHGDNSSVNVHYSGTMGVVMEGCMKGIPSIGFSLCDFDRDADFSAMSGYVRAIVSRVLREGLPERVCLNVNFPKRSSYLGVKVCRMSKGKWTNEWFKMDHPHGQSYYWLTGEFINTEPDMQDTDTWALVNGFVAVTPIQVDMTAYSAMSGLKDLENL